MGELKTCCAIAYFLSDFVCGSEKNRFFRFLSNEASIYLELVYLVTALVPSLTACLASSPGKRRRTAV